MINFIVLWIQLTSAAQTPDFHSSWNGNQLRQVASCVIQCFPQIIIHACLIAPCTFRSAKVVSVNILVRRVRVAPIFRSNLCYCLFFFQDFKPDLGFLLKCVVFPNLISLPFIQALFRVWFLEFTQLSSPIHNNTHQSR